MKLNSAIINIKNQAILILSFYLVMSNIYKHIPSTFHC